MSIDKRILIIITTGFESWGGLTTVAMNYYRAMNRTGLRIDFVSDNEAAKDLLNELEKNNSKYIRLPNRKNHVVKYMFALYKTIKHGKYDVVHVHGNSATMAFDLFPAWLAGVKKRITQVHATRNSHRFIAGVLKPFMDFLCSHRVAVSEEAGKYLYGKKQFTVLCNAIDAEHYRFSQKGRTECRRKWGIPDSAYVVGTVGKMNDTKNHFFLLDIFSKTFHRLPDAMLLIVGDGELRTEMEKKIEMLGLKNVCVLAGMQNDTAVFLSAMDTFVFPSKFEGFGMALLEAQASGLHAVCSDVIPKAAIATDLCVSLPLGHSDEWTENICNFNLPNNRGELSENAVRQIRFKGLEIKDQADKLRDVYLK